MRSRERQPPSPALRLVASYSENSLRPSTEVVGPTLGTIAEKSAHKGVGGQKRRHGVTALQALGLRVTPE
jgi:hypothetical protein